MKKALWKTFLGVLPPRWRLPVQFWRYRITRYIEPEMLLVRRWKDRNSIAIDVGANQGTYSFELSRWFSHVESFEPNYNITTELGTYDPARIRLHGVALSSANGRATLHVPLSMDGVQLVGWGTLKPEGAWGSPKFVELTVMRRTLDSYGFDNVAFIKIDVEGHEEDVLIGSKNTLRRCRPVVLIEVKLASRPVVARFFSKLDYELFFLRGGDLHQLTHCANELEHAHENVFAIPSERAFSPSRIR